MCALIQLQLTSYVHKFIWVEIGKLETNTVNIILDELMRAAVDGGMGSIRSERVADTMSSINSINVRGRILARVRKVNAACLHHSNIPLILLSRLSARHP